MPKLQLVPYEYLKRHYGHYELTTYEQESLATLAKLSKFLN